MWKTIAWLTGVGLLACNGPLERVTETESNAQPPALAAQRTLGAATWNELDRHPGPTCSGRASG